MENKIIRRPYKNKWKRELELCEAYQKGILDSLLSLEFNSDEESLSNSSPHVGTLPNGNSAEAEGLNTGLKVQKSKIPSPKLKQEVLTSLNPNIIPNSCGGSKVVRN